MEKRTGKALGPRGLWRWSWLLTLPVTALLCLWAFNTASSYHHFMLKYKLLPSKFLRDRGNMEARILLNMLKERLLPHKGGGLEALRLYIPEAALGKLDSDLPYSGREYVKGRLLYPDGKLHGVKVRYRGDYFYHWSGLKKSLRIKTGKKSLYGGVRRFNLTVPKVDSMLVSHLPYLLAGRMGLLAPESRLLEVYINDRYAGVHVFTEQLGEQFLRRAGRMPGDLYVGEMVGRDEFPGVEREVFFNHGYWRKAAENNHNPPDWDEALKELSRAIYLEDMDRLTELVDIDSWAAFAAFITICQTVHYDSIHNWRLYFDPARGRFEPVVWDPVGFHFEGFFKKIAKLENRMDIITNVIFDRLHRDHRFMAAKHAAIESFFLNGGDRYLLGVVEDTGRLEASVKGDRNLHFNSYRILPPGRVLEAIGEFKEQLPGHLEHVRKAYLETPPAASYSVADTGSIQVNVEGFNPLRFIEMEFGADVSGAEGVDVSYVVDGETFRREMSGYMAREGSVIRLDVPLFARRTMAVPSEESAPILREVVIEPATYFIDIRGLGGAPVREVRAGYADGKPLTIKRKEGLIKYPLDGGFHILPLEAAGGELVWSGEVLVDGVREVGGDLRLQPGTAVRFTPGSGLVIRGRLYAQGTAERPVRFIPAGEGQGPWGAVVLASPGADGSMLRHCSFSGGSGLRHGLLEYSAMLSIHDVRDVTVEGCSFSDNRDVDDMVHAVYSEVIFIDCEFRNAASDALDLDYVRGQVVGTSFSRSGNDALDLMTSQVAVIESRISGAEDKGISVGEGSDLLAWNTAVRDSNIGVQVKDGSKAVLYNVELAENLKGMDACLKNWQYGGGGEAHVLKSRLVGGGDGITADGKSTVKVIDSYLEGGVGGDKKRIHIDGTVDSDPEFRTRARTQRRSLDDLGLHEYLVPFLESIRPEVRGLVPDAD
jgi:hypothetical protein